MKTRNIESVQTLVDILQNIFLERKILKIKQEQYQEKLLVFIKLQNIVRYQGEPLGCITLALPN